jgi:hypothetical protein
MELVRRNTYLYEVIILINLIDAFKLHNCFNEASFYVTSKFPERKGRRKLFKCLAEDRTLNVARDDRDQ